MGCTCTQYDQVTSTAKYCCREVDEYRVMGCTCTQYDQVISTAKYCCREVDEYRVMGCPKCIDDKKYERNAFIFNFVFVFSSSMDTSSYVPVIQKMGNAFRTYEVCSDCMYVCIGDYRDPKTRELRVLVCMSKSLMTEESVICYLEISNSPWTLAPSLSNPGKTVIFRWLGSQYCDEGNKNCCRIHNSSRLTTILV